MNEKFHWITLNMVAGHIAMWAVRQSSYGCPDDLEYVLSNFRLHVRKFFDQNEMAKFNRDGLRKLLETYLFSMPQVRKWNKRKNGNKAPFQFTSRYDAKGDPDNDFIDLDALRMNVVGGVMAECDELSDSLEKTKPCLFERIKQIIWNKPQLHASD